MVTALKFLKSAPFSRNRIDSYSMKKDEKIPSEIEGSPERVYRTNTQGSSLMFKSTQTQQQRPELPTVACV